MSTEGFICGKDSLWGCVGFPSPPGQHWPRLDAQSRQILLCRRRQRQEVLTFAFPVTSELPWSCLGCVPLVSTGLTRCQWITPSPQSSLCETGLTLGFIISTGRTIISLPMIHPTLDTINIHIRKGSWQVKCQLIPMENKKVSLFNLTGCWSLCSCSLCGFQAPKLKGPFKSLNAHLLFLDFGEVF